ncbi:BsuBI/PstI family type II restriction endonuclease [Micromonospora sp. NPDC005194]|uniref:BsuBI/PstI family type II restriction endonuclease n=1 Tax=Micromonospora sp. NPDC005194 TaxID=3156870 RepID=UPI0033B8AEB1
MIYVDAVIEDGAPFEQGMYLARPTTCLWMNDGAYLRQEDDQREAWRTAAKRGRKAVLGVLGLWGVDPQPWYADNSRETLRDETFPYWMDHGAIRANPSVATTASTGRWALTSSFADLFSPDLEGDDLVNAIEEWREAHMGPGARLRILTAQVRERRDHVVVVHLPDGKTRELAPGESSLILQGVVESWMPARLSDPVVLTISEPGTKILLADAAMLAGLGLTIDQRTLLPDAVIVDIGCEPPTFWIVEAVASDGPVTGDRKAALLAWAAQQRIPVADCRFLSAFVSRNDDVARKRLKDLAAGTFAWYLDEPTRELAWYEISSDYE